MIGVLCGTFTGIIPGVHVNTIGAFLFASSNFLLNSMSPEVLAVFLISMSISHSMIDFIPTMFLGVPEEGTVLSVLPGHYFMLRGRGREAIRFVTIGGFGSLMVTIIIFPMFALLMPPLYTSLKPFIWIILVSVVIFTIFRLNKNKNKMFCSGIIFIFSGIMGWVVLNTPISSNLSLIAMFSGLFGVSTLIYSISQNSAVPKQDKFHGIKIDQKILRGIFAGGIAGSILGFLPGMGPSQGVILAQGLSGSGDIGKNREGFLVSMSGVNVSDALFSLMAIYLIGNPRSGIAVYIDKIIQNIDLNHILLLAFASMIAVSITTFFCIKLGDILIDHLDKFDYTKISMVVIIFMSTTVSLIALFEHTNLLFAFLIYLTSISLGLLPHYMGISKSNLMGVLIIPAIVIYAGLA